LRSAPADEAVLESGRDAGEAPPTLLATLVSAIQACPERQIVAVLSRNRANLLYFGLSHWRNGRT
jgi:hypothetical protein